jgi:gamma-glutamyl-gamma-aminobutyrate hydrolase PuuD
MKRPAVVVVTRRTIRKDKYIDYVGEFHLALLIRVGLLPVMVPVVEGTPACVGDYMENMRGLLLVEGEDVGPDNYRARPENFKHLEDTHPLKDAIETRLVRAALRRKLPILGICRGAQLLNTVCGGTLFGDVQKEKKSRLKHIDYAHYDTYRHAISLVPDAPLEEWYGPREVAVNSYHHQGIRDLAPRFRPMAHAADGLTEGYYDPKADFVMGFQFHPERMAEEAEANLRIWKAFGAAVRRVGAGGRGSAGSR